MSKSYWSLSDIYKLFRLQGRVSKQTVLNAEERGEIPKAERIARGNIKVRQWRVDQLPAIGEKFGFLKKPNKQIVIAVYTPKGGVTKTTSACNAGRFFALNGLKTCLIGLDIQLSLTNYALPKPSFNTLEDYEYHKKTAKKRFGLYHLFYENAPLSEVVMPTTLPTLSIIPETPELNLLEKKLRLEPRREYIFKDKLVNLLNEFDVIIFDLGPGWNQLTETALTASNNITAPIGCDIETYEALETNLEMILEFQDSMKLKWDNFILFPTLLEKTGLSQQIYGVYLHKYANRIIPIPIRRSVKAQEARVLNVSVIEYDPKSDLAQDYYELMIRHWDIVSNGCVIDLNEV